MQLTIMKIDAFAEWAASVGALDCPALAQRSARTGRPVNGTALEPFIGLIDSKRSDFWN